MKRNVIALALVLGCAVGSNAQTTNDYGFGLRAAWDLDVPATNYPGLDNGSGFSVGAFYDVPVARNLFIEPGLSYFYNTMDAELIESNYSPAVKTGTWRNMGLRVPVYFGYKFDVVEDISMSVVTGPQVNLGLSLEENFGDITSKNLYDNGWKRVDAQWMVGLRLHYQNNFVVEIAGGLGMNNLLDGDKYPGFHVRRNVFTIGVGYQF